MTTEPFRQTHGVHTRERLSTGEHLTRECSGDDGGRDGASVAAVARWQFAGVGTDVCRGMQLGGTHGRRLHQDGASKAQEVTYPKVGF
uniref:Uncharacterized protein n=1 Tax=Arundo donax TaxID=35708 RepID=A0A0A9GRJ2_ARUDO